jgi:peptidoglycan hydrolase CwlO-like protein
MKRMSIVLAAAVFMATASPAFSQMTQSEKDECMLASKNCVNQVDDIYKRIHKLDKEIKKGKKVYAPAELKKLQEKLTETQELLKSMEKPGR